MIGKNPAATAWLADFIVRKLKELRLSQVAACELAGLQKDAIRDIVRGSMPSTNKLTRLAPVLGVPVTELLDLLEPENRLNRSQIHTTPIDQLGVKEFDAGPNDLRLYRQGDFGLDGYRGDVSVDAISRPDVLLGRSKAYALYVPDNLNAPMITEGHTAYIDPGRPVQVGRLARVFPRTAPPFIGILEASPSDEIVVSVSTEDKPRRFAVGDVARMERVVAVVLMEI